MLFRTMGQCEQNLANAITTFKKKVSNIKKYGNMNAKITWNKFYFQFYNGRFESRDLVDRSISHGITILFGVH